MASVYVYMEQQYKSIKVEHKKAAMKRGWFKTNFANINKISKDIKKKIEKEHPDLVAKQRAHDKNMKVVEEELPKPGLTSSKPTEKDR